MTSVMPSSYAFARQYGTLLNQLGATKVDTSDPFTLKLTYTNNAAAVNAQAAFNDSVWGARLLVVNESLTPDAPQPSVQGVQALLAGVPGVETTVAIPRGPSSVQHLLVSGPDRTVIEGLQYLLRERPTLQGGNVAVSVFHKPAGEPPA